MMLGEYATMLYEVYVRVVAALAHVDVVVGVNRLLRSELAAEDLNSTVGDDLGAPIN
jgi:hypothetical protein